MANTEQFDLEDVANLDEAKYESGGKHDKEEEEEEEESSCKKGKMKEEAENVNEVSKSLAGKTIMARGMKSHEAETDYDAPAQEKHLKKHEAGLDRYSKKFGQKAASKLSGALEKKIFGEETLAGSSLHPAARHSDPMPKVAAMHGVMNMMAGMSKSDMTDFFNKVMAEFGPGKDFGVGDKSAANQSTIDMKPSHAVASSGPKTRDAMPKLNVKEDIDEMLAGQDLSEEFKDNVTTLFEAAVSARVIAEQTRLEEEFETQLDEQIAIFNEEITAKLDTYLDYVVENWMKENEVAIESTLRNELADEFIEGLKNLFAEHYINVPEDKVDVLEAMAEKVDALETRLDETISENVELKNFVVENQRQDIVEELASDLALTQQEKFSALVEGIEFDGDLDTYARKLMIVKENYFKNETTSHSSNIEEETFEGTISESVNVDPVVGRYVQALARTVKK